MKELKKELAKTDLNESVKGRYCEELIIACFQNLNFHHNKEKLQIFYWSQFDLAKAKLRTRKIR